MSDDASAPRAIGLNLLWLVPGVVGGSEEYTTRLLRAVHDLAPPDLSFTLFVNSSFPQAYPDLTTDFPTVIGPVSGASKPLRVLAENLWLGVQSRRHHIDVMHHMGGILPAWRPSSIVLTIHDLQPLAMPGHFSTAKRGFSAFVIPRSVRAAPNIVTLTEFTKQDMATRLGIDPVRVVVVAPGLDLPPAHVDPDAEARVRRRYHLGGRRFFLFPAKTWPHKNHEMLLHAFGLLHERHPDVLLVLTGGEAQTEGRVHELACELRLAGAIRRTGRISADDLDALYRSAAALTFPSLYEGFGLPVLEAMSRGCPVLAADATALPEVVDDAGLLVPAHDPEEWSTAMERVLDDDELRQRLVTAGHQRALAYDWIVAAQVLCDVYRQAPQP